MPLSVTILQRSFRLIAIATKHGQRRKYDKLGRVVLGHPRGGGCNGCVNNGDVLSNGTPRGGVPSKPLPRQTENPTQPPSNKWWVTLTHSLSLSHSAVLACLLFSPHSETATTHHDAVAQELLPRRTMARFTLPLGVWVCVHKMYAYSGAYRKGRHDLACWSLVFVCHGGCGYFVA